ncbi:MAG: Uma2 family endonuclease [Planctomycetota bacterium]
MDIPLSENGQPAWAVATLFPCQGQWSEHDYLSLPTNHLIELSDGRLEVLAMPTERHQLVALWLYRKLDDWVKANQLGIALAAPMRMRTSEGRFRDPDVLFMRGEHSSRRHNAYWDGADFVAEVVSEDDPDRDRVVKRQEYAKVGIPEYWILDPRDQSIAVLVLDPGQSEYREAMVVSGQEIARSIHLPGFEVVTAEAFDHKH